jgi:NodT family efflux transporter outer membrane factor (OMF) lipoprotein
MKFVPRIILYCFPAILGGCSFNPPHQAPEMEVPPHFKEGAGWKVAQPAAHVPRGDWWSIFHDRELSTIEQGVEVSNQSLQAAAARAEAVAALLTAAKMALLPTANVNASGTRSKSGSQGGSTNANSLNSRGQGVQDLRSVAFTSSWEIDLWGRLRHGARAATADAQAAQADVESTRLSLLAQAAQTYFSLRAVDAQTRLLASEVESLQKSLEMTQNRKAGGVDSGSDVAQAATQLANTRAALIELGVQRATLEHALATLTGRAPAAFDVKGSASIEAALAANIPVLPSALPSTLLQRRPDIAAAERRVAAANERIGAARAAFFPTLNLSADDGWRGIADLFAKSNNFWSLGVDVAESILDSGKRVATKLQADATWKETVASYRQTVLTALQEAEDALATLRILAEETVAQDEAVRAARESERIATNQYKAGTLSYINVAIAQASALTAERTAIDLRARRLNATVALIKALGGGW